MQGGREEAGRNGEKKMKGRKRESQLQSHTHALMEGERERESKPHYSPPVDCTLTSLFTQCHVDGHKVDTK